MERFLEQWVLAPQFFRALRKTLKTVKGGRHSLDPEGTISLGVVLSDGWQYFRDKAAASLAYAEFGSGESTVFMASHTLATVRSIETDMDWVRRVEESCPRRVDVVYVDVGSTGSGGRPTGYERAGHFGYYRAAPFKGGYSPDFLLIDGRFRVACFAQALLLAKPGTTIVMDDYVSRSRYHVVEQLLTPDHVGSRQAFFTRPERIPRAKVETMLDKFEYVMD